MTLIELPLGLPGRAYASPMPFGPSDPRGTGLAAFADRRVSAVVLLVSIEECLRYARRDLPALYRQGGLEVLHLPVPDLGVPEPEAIDPVLDQAVQRLEAGRHVVIHCVAGIGRTGTFAACLARQRLHLSGQEAIVWVRRLIPSALEGAAQMRFVLDYEPAPPSARD